MDSTRAQTSPKWQTYKQRLQQRPARDTQPWTTTRCHRLLRPLKTHIFALRREMEQESGEALSDNASMDEVSGPIGGPSLNNGRYRHTYSRRGRKPAAGARSHAAQPRELQNVRMSGAMELSRKKSLQPGEIILPTPIIRRARQQVVSSLQQPALSERAPQKGDRSSDCNALDLPRSHSMSKPSSTISTLEGEMLPLRHCVSPSRFFLYESILRALHALLIATASPAPSTPSSTTSTSATRDTKSLMAMCLRKIPEYIGELEYWEQRDTEEKGTKSTLQSSEVSNRVYEAVEDLLPSSHGCSHLRTIVREHGMGVVRRALLEGLLDDHFSLLLVALCVRTKAYLEAEGLLEVILDRSYPRPKSVDSAFEEGRSLAPLKTLCDLARVSGRPQFMLRQLLKLMKTSQLSLDWLSTKQFASIWSGIVKTLSGYAVCDDTVSCAAHMLILLSSQARSAAFTLRPGKGDLKSLSQHTLISAISTLTSVCLLQQAAGVGSAHYPKPNTACTILTRIRYIIEACTYELKGTRNPGWISQVFGLSAYFTNTTQADPATDASEVWHRVLQNCNRGDGQQHHEAVMALLSSLARCCGQGAAEPSHYYLTKLCNQLDSMACVEGGKSRQMRTDCAFLLAERTNDMRDLAFAESFNGESGYCEMKMVKNTPKKRKSISTAARFRWDGDISEWVTATPALPSRRASTKIDEWSRESAAKTWRDETDSDSGFSGDEASSAKRCGAHKRTPTRWTRSVAARTSRCTQQKGSATVPSTRKRSSAVAGLLSLKPSHEGAGGHGDPSEDEDGNEDGDDGLAQPRSSGHHRAGGQENRISVTSVTGAKKRCRAEDAHIMKPRRVIMRTISNIGHPDLSDDELGL